MPLYEYRCDHCEAEFEALVRNSEDLPKCPQCGTLELTKKFSVPASVKVQGSGSSLPVCPPMAMPPGGCGGPACQGGFCGGMD
ncbi:MAG: hypothetical protein RJA81_383 [Planctomycetota bacterium]|jgi:putative FmdB family regulatory protein